MMKTLGIYTSLLESFCGFRGNGQCNAWGSVLHGE